MKLTYNFHTHTKRCGHAKGEDEEYIINAINAGFKVLGFSDHVMLPGIHQVPIRADYEVLPEYVSTIKELKQKYKDQIEIHVGFECEYFSDFIDFYKQLLEEGTVEYLILGQHFYFSENGKLESCTFFAEDIIKAQNKYVDLLIEGIKTGLFKYVCHPDIYCMLEDEWTPEFEEMAHRICKAAKEEDIPLEINLNRTKTGSPEDWKYPNENFWKIASQYGNKVVIGVDAHEPDRFSTSNFDYAYYLIEKYKLDYIENFNVK